MFPTVSCLPLTLVLSLIVVDSATFFGFSPDVVLVRVTFDIEQEVLFVSCVCCHLFSAKNGSYVTVSFSGCHWQCGASHFDDDREARLREDIAEPTEAFRIWRTMDRGHFAEIVWFGRGVRTL